MNCNQHRAGHDADQCFNVKQFTGDAPRHRPVIKQREQGRGHKISDSPEAADPESLEDFFANTKHEKALGNRRQASGQLDATSDRVGVNLSRYVFTHTGAGTLCLAPSA